MSEIIKIEDLSYLPEHEHYIKYKCNRVDEVYCTGIYFKDENNPESSGMNIGYHGYPKPLSQNDQELVLTAINAACNTNFQLVTKKKEIP